MRSSNYTIGLDLGDRWHHVCILNGRAQPWLHYASAEGATGALQRESLGGGDYNSMVISKDWRSISIQLSSGTVVEWTKQ